MAGNATDNWAVAITVQAGPYTVVVREESDGVNGPKFSATVDGHPVKVEVKGQVLIDGITPSDGLKCSECSYLAIDEDDLAEHREANHDDEGEPYLYSTNEVRNWLAGRDFDLALVKDVDLYRHGYVVTLVDDVDPEVGEAIDKALQEVSPPTRVSGYFLG